jgi:transcriptional regulator with XRE-family HTH domain
MTVEQRVHQARAQDVDRHLAARMHERRIMLGLPQQQLAELIGVSYQQVHKYEKGINRVPASRLYTIALALEVEIGYFYEGLRTAVGFIPPAQERMLVDLAHNFLNIPVQEHRTAIVALARGLAQAADAKDNTAKNGPSRRFAPAGMRTTVGGGER